MNSQKVQRNVTPAEAGVQNQLKALDSGLRRNDGNGRFPFFLRGYHCKSVPWRISVSSASGSMRIAGYGKAQEASATRCSKLTWRRVLRNWSRASSQMRCTCLLYTSDAADE